jgi:uncharacterized OB-fold protein
VTVPTPGWFDALTDAIDAEAGTYRVCTACGTAVLPPRECCPECGGAAFDTHPLPDHGTVRSFTEIHVTIPAFHGETPYIVGLVEFDGRLTLTGQLRGAAADEVAIDDDVVVGTERRDGGTTLVTFRPAE